MNFNTSSVSGYTALACIYYIHPGVYRYILSPENASNCYNLYHNRSHVYAALRCIYVYISSVYILTYAR